LGNAKFLFFVFKTKGITANVIHGRRWVRKIMGFEFVCFVKIHANNDRVEKTRKRKGVPIRGRS